MARLFTRAEANALLPRLTREFELLHQLRSTARDQRAELARLEAKGKSNGRDVASEIREHQERLEKIGAQAKAILDGITGLGCEIKDVDQGLVDFPSPRDGRTVYLCWKVGEESIGYWHELSTGFAGRQPL
jgi:hypothetical protein